MFQKFQEKIDVIGDIHGHYQQLWKMLEKLGYLFDENRVSHPENRKLCFVGDFINRGPHSIEVLSLVRSLVEEGIASAVLGNHEFRLIQEFVAEKKVPSKYEPFLPWLRTLPLFLELEKIRIVHAAWHFSSIDLLQEKEVTDDVFIMETMQKKSPFKKAVSRILSGIKINIPKNLKLVDRFGIRRPKGRLKWWMNLRGKSYAECFLSPMSPDIFNQGPRDDEISWVEPYPGTEKPVFIGHYCLPPTVPKINGQVVCIDGCVTCDQQLWAYRYQGEHRPSTSNLMRTV